MIDEMERRALEEVHGLEAAFIQLGEDMADDLPEISEAEFLKFWLPYLASVDGDVHVNAWVNQVSKNACQSVRVIKDGKVVCVVPPVMNTKAITKTRYSHQQSLHEVIGKAIDRGATNPRRANHIFYQMVGDATLIPEIDHEQVAQWNDILIRYGYPSIHKAETADAITNSPVGLQNGGPSNNEVSLDDFEEV